MFWTWLPEEPFVPERSPASMKLFCLFGLLGMKCTLRSIRKFPGFSVAPQLLLGEATSMLCRGHPRRGERLTLSWLPSCQCQGATQQRWGRTARHSSQAALTSPDHPAAPLCLQPRLFGVRKSHGKEKLLSQGELRGRFVGGDAKSQTLSLSEVLLGCGGKKISL